MTQQDTAAINRIAAAIRADDEFTAVQLILIFQNRANATNAEITAWMLGPIQGQAVISDFITDHDIDLEPSNETAEPKAQPVKHKTRRIANGIHLYRMHEIRQIGGFPGKRGMWSITEDGESKPRDSAGTLQEAKAMIDQWNGTNQ